MTNFLLSLIATSGALFAMMVIFKLAAKLTHTVKLERATSILPDFDFTTTQKATVRKQSSQSSKPSDQAEQCWKLFRQGSYAESEIQVTLLLTKTLNDRTRVRCLHLLSLLLMEEKNFADAEKHLWQAIKIQAKYKDPIDELDLRLALARLFHLNNVAELGLRQLERIIVISESLGDRLQPGFKTEVLAPSLMNLGESYLQENRRNEAIECFKRVVSTLEAHGGSELLAANARIHLESLNR